MRRTRTRQFSQAKEKIKMRWKEVKCKNCEITEESRDFLFIHQCKNDARRWKNSQFISRYLMITQICSVNPSHNIKVDSLQHAINFNFCRNITLSLILRRSRTGTVWFYTSTSNKRAAWPKLYTKSLTMDLKRMYSRFTLVRISINL